MVATMKENDCSIAEMRSLSRSCGRNRGSFDSSLQSFLFFASCCCKGRRIGGSTWAHHGRFGWLRLLRSLQLLRQTHVSEERRGGRQRHGIVWLVQEVVIIIARLNCRLAIKYDQFYWRHSSNIWAIRLRSLRRLADNPSLHKRTLVLWCPLFFAFLCISFLLDLLTCLALVQGRKKLSKVQPRQRPWQIRRGSQSPRSDWLVPVNCLV